MPIFTDQLGRTIELFSTPNRIISLVPSQTELLYDLGLREEVVGITKFCVHPDEWFRTKKRVGGTKQLRLDIIRALKPDLIIANKEENVKEQVEEMAKEFPTWISDVNNLEEALSMIRDIGELVGKEEAAQQWIQTISTSFQNLSLPEYKPLAAYLIWKDPYMTVGGDTFIHSMMEAAGYRNKFENQSRYPVIGPQDLEDCDIILFSSEPFPFKHKHAKELLRQLSRDKMSFAIVDGEAFSWYGSRLAASPAYFNKLRQVAMIS